MELSTSRPRVLGWLRSAAILDGDWGTSIAYVLGIAFFLAGYSSGLHLVMMVVFTGMVAVNYITICRLYPSGGGVYSSVSHRSRTMAVIGALLLCADYVITASLSVLEACHYFGFTHEAYWAVGIILGLGILNWFGPRHAGTFAVTISLATLVSLIILMIGAFPTSISNITLHAAPGGFFENWKIFVGIILAISGIEAISNMTGVMKDPLKSSRKAILTVLTKITLATLILGFAMIAVPNLDTHAHKEDMIRFLGDVYVGPWFGSIIGFTLGLLLISAGNTAINALASIQFLMSVDGELPKNLRRLNVHGVPVFPLIFATLIPAVVLLIVHDVITLAQMYAIGVVGAILVNIGSTATDREIKLPTRTRVFMLVSTVILFLVETTIAIEKTKALIFAVTVLAIGLTGRYLARRQSSPSVVFTPASPLAPSQQSMPKTETYSFSSRIMVSVRGKGEQLLRQACEEAKLRKAFLFVLHIKQIALLGALPDSIPEESFSNSDWMVKVCNEYGIPYKILTVISNEVGYTIAEQAATLGVDRLILGATQRTLLAKALRGDVIQEVSHLLPEEIQLVIYRA